MAWGVARLAWHGVGLRLMACRVPLGSCRASTGPHDPSSRARRPPLHDSLPKHTHTHTHTREWLQVVFSPTCSKISSQHTNKNMNSQNHAQMRGGKSTHCNTMLDKGTNTRLANTHTNYCIKYTCQDTAVGHSKVLGGLFHLFPGSDTNPWH